MWHSSVDVEAVVAPKQVLNYVLKYLLKAHGKSVQGKTALGITQEGAEKTLLWVYRKRGWSSSGDFREAVADSIQRSLQDWDFKPTLTEVKPRLGGKIRGKAARSRKTVL